MESVEVYQNFNPRSPWGERLKGGVNMLSKIRFQSTLSVRRATGFGDIDIKRLNISIHALREESDDKGIFARQKTYIISIHALREESDG